MFLLFLSLAQAQEELTEQPQIIIPKEQKVDFGEGLEIEGQLFKPAGDLIRERKVATFNPLIKLREDFTLEMKHSVTEIR
jgi:hypothetical protein